MPQPQLLFSFRGAVQCRVDARGPLTLSLVGWAADAQAGEGATQLQFSNASVESCPAQVQDARITGVGERSYRIDGAGFGLELSATAMHVHRDLSAAFECAVPPRRASLSKRLFWRAILATAALPGGWRLLRKLRQRGRAAQELG